MTEPRTPDPGGQESEAPAPPAATSASATPAAGTASTGWSQVSARAEVPVPGAAGLVYADVPNRIFALIIDGIILAIITAIINGILYGIVGQPVTFGVNTGFGFNFLPLLVGAIVSLAISAGYFIYSWTTMRQTLGMRLLGMQVGNFPDGKTLTQDQAIRRWAALYGVPAIGQVAYVAPTLGALLGLLTFAYVLYLLWTTAQSPTKQGFHDTFANSVVVKAARSV